jgi:uncharacterized membrane protein
MNPVKGRIEEIKNNGYSLDFGAVFNHAFENYKKVALYAGSVILIFTVLLSVGAIAAALSFFTISELKEIANPENMMIENLAGVNLLIYSGSIVVLSCLFTPFFAGFIKMCHAAQKDEEFKVTTLFYYYKTPYIQELVTITALISIINMAVSAGFKEINLEFVGALLNLLINFLTVLVVPFIAFGKLTGIEAIRASFIVILKQPLVILALIITAYIGSLVGFVGCCIGVFFTLPFLYSMYYAIYSAIIGFQDEEQIR